MSGEDDLEWLRKLCDLAKRSGNTVEDFLRKMDYTPREIMQRRSTLQAACKELPLQKSGKKLHKSIAEAIEAMKEHRPARARKHPAEKLARAVKKAEQGVPDDMPWWRKAGAFFSTRNPMAMSTRRHRRY